MPYTYDEETKHRKYIEPKEYREIVEHLVAVENCKNWPEYYQQQIEFLSLAIENNRVLPDCQARALLTLYALQRLSSSARRGTSRPTLTRIK